MPKNTHNAAGLAAILFAVIVWGAMPFFVEAAAREMPAGQLTVLRLLLPGLILTAAVGPRNLAQTIRRNRLLFFLLAFAGFALPQLFYIYALQSGLPVPLLTFIATGYPALSLILAIIILKERPTWLHCLAMGAALVGLYLLAGPDFSAGAAAAMGVTWALLSACGWATSGIIGKQMTARLAPLPIVAGRHILGGLIIAPLMFLEPTTMHDASLNAWLAVASLVFMSIASYYAYYRGLARTTLSSASLLESFAPVVTLFIGVLLGRPGMNATQLTGAALVLAGAVTISILEITILPPQTKLTHAPRAPAPSQYAGNARTPTAPSCSRSPSPHPDTSSGKNSS